jgi:hypothetical protein
MCERTSCVGRLGECFLRYTLLLLADGFLHDFPPPSQMVYFSTAGHTLFTTGLCAIVLRTAGVFTTGD